MKLNAKKKSSTKSTQTWLNVWENWPNERKFNPEMEEYEHEDLNKKLRVFYAEALTHARWIRVGTGEFKVHVGSP